MLVYVATNKVNNKQYVGYTTIGLNSRIKNHLKKAYNKSGKHYNYYFQRSIRKYSINSFTWDVIRYCSSKKECIEKEIEYIKKYNSIHPNGYNLTHGGDGGSPSEETKLKISKSIKKIHQNNPDVYNRMINMTPESRSNAAKKAWDTKRANGFKTRAGHKASNESKQKMSNTKNNNNKISWINCFSGEIIHKSMTDMHKFTGLSIGVFSHIKMGRYEKTRCGWMLYCKDKIFN